MNIFGTNKALVTGTLLLVAFASHFLFMQKFGLYEDDYVFINLGWTLDELAGQIKHVLVSWPSGRPIGNVIPFSISYLGQVFDSLIPVYIAGYLFIAINSILVFSILRTFAPDHYAFIGALTYIVFPADTTRVLLIHSLGIQSGLTFTLLAAFLYLKGMRVIPYLLSLMSLLTYETTWLPFIFLPLLAGAIDRRSVVSWLKHLLIMVMMLVLVIGVRSLLGEVRMGIVADANPLEFIIKIVSLLFIGPIVSASTFLIRPVSAVLEGDVIVYLVMAVAALLLGYIFMRLKNAASDHAGRGEEAAELTLRAASLTLVIGCRKDFLVAVRMVAIGLLMWMSVYILSYTHWPAFTIEGRLTSVHIAASVPAAIFAAGLIWLLLQAGGHAIWSRYTAFGLAAYFALLVGWNANVQNDYVKSWDNQKAYWRQIIELAPDIDEGSQVFIVAGRFPPETRYIATHSWADYMMLRKIYRTNIRDTALQPKVNVIGPGNVNTFRVREGKLVRVSMRPKPGGGHAAVEEVIDTGKMIVLVYQNNEMKRLKGTFAISNKIRVKLPDQGQATKFEPTTLYRLIMDQTT